MSTYVIGDVQGCYKELMDLLALIEFDDKKDRLWFTGDLINRGPHSLKVMRFVKKLGTQAVSVLGNHELHYLAVASGIEPLREEDTFQDMLEASDAQILFDWMRHLPLIYKENEFLLVHAGIAPQWTLETSLACAAEVETVLRGKSFKDLLKNMYGNSPARWDPALKSYERLRLIINYCTRMRYIDEKGNLELQYKGREGDQTDLFSPWFKMPACLSPDIHIIFGHWAALGGVTDTPRRYALDTGCSWGNALTALRLEDLHYFNVQCHYSGVSYE